MTASCQVLSQPCIPGPEPSGHGHGLCTSYMLLDLQILVDTFSFLAGKRRGAESWGCSRDVGPICKRLPNGLPAVRVPLLCVLRDTWQCQPFTREPRHGRGRIPARHVTALRCPGRSSLDVTGPSFTLAWKAACTHVCTSPHTHSRRQAGPGHSSRRHAAGFSHSCPLSGRCAACPGTSVPVVREMM